MRLLFLTIRSALMDIAYGGGTSSLCEKFGMQARDFLLSSNILLSGNNYAKVALLLKFTNIRMVNQTTHYTIQDTYCVDTIKEYWEEKRSEAIRRLQGEDVVLLGDGRNDSPGHSAQYCSYTTMELDTKEIVYVATIDKRQTNWNSNIMEKEGFIQTVEKLTKEIKVVESCTDAHVQIGALLNPDKSRYKELRIHHSLDIWHGAKNLSKKIAAVSSTTSNFIHNTTLYRPACQLNHCIMLGLHAKIHAWNNLHCLCFAYLLKAGKLKGQSILLHWLRDVVNHFWWCCKTADTFQQFLVSKINIYIHSRYTVYIYIYIYQGTKLSYC
ncbi:hypothetical protein N1851_011713 [Merluccius polli]|uniref:Uncharacterized protein n=1 Tax=Merluccius polli TaxID=89951 RepID=A0AA47MXG1_MERPO|nr:hypothetical protein N1851_011713 [Merluccius polli]